jgi:hypothetical protein
MDTAAAQQLLNGLVNQLSKTGVPLSPAFVAHAAAALAAAAQTLRQQPSLPSQQQQQQQQQSPQLADAMTRLLDLTSKRMGKGQVRVCGCRRVAGGDCCCWRRLRASRIAAAQCAFAAAAT